MDKRYLLLVGVFGIVIVLSLAATALVLRKSGGEPAKSAPAGPALAPSSPENTATPSSESEAERVKIDYTEKGFTPANVTVKKGTIVIFINKAAKGAMLVEATSPSTFAQPGASEVYSFIPNNAGTWNYHNRLNATASGTITVP